MGSKKNLAANQSEALLKTLKDRFEKNKARHKGIEWPVVLERLTGKFIGPEKLCSLSEMERTGGEPDVVDMDKKTGEIIFVDCAAESPAGRKIGRAHV